MITLKTTAYSKTWIVIEISLFKACLNCNSHYVGSSYTLMKSLILHFVLSVNYYTPGLLYGGKISTLRIDWQRRTLGSQSILVISLYGLDFFLRSQHTCIAVYIGSSDRTNLMFSRGNTFFFKFSFCFILYRESYRLRIDQVSLVRYVNHDSMNAIKSGNDRWGGEHVVLVCYK